MEKRPEIQIKGIRDGLMITLGEGDWQEIQQDLLVLLDQQHEFFRGARIALDVGNHILKAAEMGKLRDNISEREIFLWALLSNSPLTEKTAQALGLATQISKPALPQSQTGFETSIAEGEDAILLHRTLRSGYSLHYPGHVVIIGDVNPGAEIIASGDIIVWGRLRGLVHAGAEGSEGAVICALDLSPTQLRIAGKIAVTPSKQGKVQPEVAYLSNGRVVAKAWNSRKGK